MKTVRLPGKVESIWSGTTPSTNFSALSGKLQTDVAVIGGGIAGINAAYLLKQSGLKVAVIEATYIAAGTSGNTTAKVTSQHKLKYSYLIHAFGKEKAQLYADSNQWAIKELERIIAKEGIDCDFSKLPAYTYTRNRKDVREIKNEVKASTELNLPASFVGSVESIPFKIYGAIKFGGQASFHPRKYLLAIADKINSNGSYIFEKTDCLGIEEGNNDCVVITDRGNVTAKFAIIATNFPFYDPLHAFSQMRHVRSYVLAVKTGSKIPFGVFIGTSSEDISFRSHVSGGRNWLVIGGVHHLAGESVNAVGRYQKLGRCASEYFNAKSIDYMWAAQDSMSLDRVPYIGYYPESKRIMVTTGFSAWGMTTSFVSAKLLADIILGQKNEWEDIYSPSRITLTQKKRIAAKRNKGDKMDLAMDEGKVLSQKGRNIAVYKDKSGKIFTLSAVCTHLGCTVTWNIKDKTWDCPCHGSRFDIRGKVIKGPAIKNLPEVNNHA